MIAYDQIREVHLEISSLCNARCPLCPRNFRGYPYNDGYVEANLTLDNTQHIFSPIFLKQLTRIWINGNFGDAVMNPETPDIVEYFRSHNKDLIVDISTNGSARDQEFWIRLAQANASVYFCLDGLEDTHHLYRQNTSWTTILNNAKIFIDAGGQAIWKMIKFKHNEHQLEDCKNLSKQLGFTNFELVDHGRNQGPVFDRHGNLQHVLGEYQGETSFEILFHKKRTDIILLEDIVPYVTYHPKINCYTKQAQSIYISSTGDVYPCCFTGFNPRTYGKGEYYEAVNTQLASLINNNNALEHSLQECIQWFNKVENSWDKDSFEAGRLVCCNDNCGFDKYTKLE
jgi:MoaA/NifB/PqqE/SkfB family radical SAM enzyme